MATSSPFSDLTSGSKTAQSVDAYRAGNPALWGNQFAAIQTGQMKIGPSSVAYDSDGNPEGTYALILDSEGNPTGWKAEQVAPNVYDLQTTHGDYLQHMVFRTDQESGYIEPIQDTGKQVNFGRWNYAGSGLSSMFQNPVAGLMLSTLLPGAGSAIGSALGLGEGALASAAGSSLLGGATSSLAGGDFTKGALAGGLGSLAGSALNAGNVAPGAEEIAAAQAAAQGMGGYNGLEEALAAQAAAQAAPTAQPTGIEALTEAVPTPVSSPTALTPTPIPEPAGIQALTPEAGALGATSDMPWANYTPEQVNALSNVTVTPEPTGIQTLPAAPSDYLAADAAQTQANLQNAVTPTPEPVAITPTPSTPSTPTAGTEYSDYGSATGPGAPGTSMTSVPTGEGTASLVDTTGVAPAAAAGAAAASPGIFQSIADATGLPLGLIEGAAGALGIKALGSVLTPAQPATTQVAQTPVGVGLSSSYQPYTYKPYAGGGAVEHMSNANAIGANTGFPMANIQRGAYATPYQQPISQNVVTGPQDTRVDPYTGEELLAGGGIASLGAYSDGGRMLRGPGDGVSDSIPAVIGAGQPARLADGEFVIPARIVSELGNGSTEAGARQLYAMMDRIQAARRKSVGKGKVAVDSKAAKQLPA